MLQDPILLFVMVVDHGEEMHVRVDGQNPAEFPDRRPLRDFNQEFPFPETREIGIVAFKAGKEFDLQLHQYTPV